jgi:predicted RNase H-like HicB family nuclease
MSITSHYSMLIEWSDEDQAFLVTLPEWAGRVNTPTTHGDTYEQAVRNGNEVLELLIEATLADGDPLPHPKVYAGV